MGLNWWVFLCGSNKLWNYRYAWTYKKQLFSAVLFKDKCFAVLFFATLAKLVDNVTGPLFKVQRSTFKPVLVSEELKLFNRANIWRRKKHCMNCGNKWKNLILPRKQQCRLKALLRKNIALCYNGFLAIFSSGFFWRLYYEQQRKFNLYWNIQGDLFTDPHCSVPKWKNANVLNQSCYF